MSFTDWNMNRFMEPVFNGFENFQKLFNDEVFVRSIGNTFLFAVTTTIGKIVLGLALALLLVKPVKGNNIFRTIFYMPCVLSTVVVGILFNAILGRDGLLNEFTAVLGIKPIDWLGSYSTAMLWIILMEIWMWGGFCMFIFISGLQSIPQEYYECAEIEGASKTAKFFKITLPLLMPSFTVVMTLNITGGLKVFDMVYILTNGGPGFDTQVLNTYTYRSFSMGFLGQSCASAVILSVIIVLVTFTVNNFLKKREVEM
ncbi:MAG: sugar ABC transporter permease [Lachnospiraceae bacterium]|nr:sugar ABC transporter permease [Lachnospiraceae bacterium]